MRSIDAMIVWTPNSEFYNDDPSKGQIRVTLQPEQVETESYPCSIGACDEDWRATDEQGRRELMQEYFSRMIHHDNMDEQSIRAALSVIEDFNPAFFSNREPTLDE